MKRTCLVIVIWFALTHSFAFAQDEKTELAVFAGGYFNSGFQSFKVLNPSTGARLGTFKPVSEANYFNQRGTWRPFFTVGAGGITKTSKLAFVQNLLPVGVRVSTVLIISPTLVPATTRTDRRSCLKPASRNIFRTDWA